MTTISPDNIIEIELFQNLFFQSIDKKFVEKSIIALVTLFEENDNFLIATNLATYAYGERICSYLSFKHDPNQPQRISCLDDMKIAQIDSGKNFVAILTDDGQVYLASDSNNWKIDNVINCDRFKMIRCGREHLLLLRQDGTIFAMGDNHFGQITCHFPSSYRTMINTGIENVELIACGQFHNIAVTNSGEIYSWGRNDCGQLGLGDNRDRNKAALVKFPDYDDDDDSIDTRIKNIVAGSNYSLFLLENGQLWGCGSNSVGELGLGDKKNRSKLTKIPIDNVQKIACSKFHNFSLAHDGLSYYAWGKTINGDWLSPRKLDGQPTSFASAAAMILSSPITFGLTSTIYVFEYNDPLLAIQSISRLFNNPDDFDVEFIIGEQCIRAWKCYLKMASVYFCRMFSGDWGENNRVIIKDYSYDIYYAYLRWLHDGYIRIDHTNIDELFDIANCYCDERLQKQCKKFIGIDLNEQTLIDYLPLIKRYEIGTGGLQNKISHLTMENVMPKIIDNLLADDNENCMEKFLQWFYFEQSFLEK
ncbi:RCC1 and BTB domain-containing protein 1-like [Dermatophagoides farinae]|uniref:RCC1 and BTB domain-containing protein 1-like n=1 Tax=Dermatophagoides farinae TaxID=6954 RepID=UPI003F627ACA